MSDKSIYRLCGGLFIFTLTTFALREMLAGGLIDSESISNTYRMVADSAFQYRLAVWIDFIGVVALMALVVTLFYILKPFGIYLALLALGLRTGEVILLAVLRIDDFTILTLSQQAASASGSGVAALNYLGQMLVSRADQGFTLAMVFYAIGSLFNNILFYRSKAIPFWLVILGLLGASLVIVQTVLSLIIDLPLITYWAGWGPIMLFEFIVGFYLIFYGKREETS